LLLSKLSEAEMRLKTNVSDISVIDKAKNLGQGPIAPNTSFIRNALLGGFLDSFYYFIDSRVIR
jgi:capsular polysaccharide biosynthesis protein